mgnify:CR=1 FL=1
MTEQIDATNTTEHMADAESTAESAKAAVRGVEETHPEYVDFAVDDFPGGLPACLEAILMVADQPQTATELARILALDRNTVEEALRALHDDYEGDESRDIRPRGFELRRTARAGSSPVAPRSSRSSHHSSPTARLRDSVRPHWRRLPSWPIANPSPEPKWPRSAVSTPME